MEKVATALIVTVSFLLPWNAFSQDVIQPGLARAQLTISPSYMFADRQSHFYLHGNLEVYASKNISLVGEGYYYMNALSGETSPFDFNHSGFFGVSWHRIKNNSDFYIGIQPGLSFTRLTEQESNTTKTHTGVNPLFSSIVGYNFFVTRFFHFFVQTRIVAGEHNSDMHRRLTEMRFSAGLGVNVGGKK